MESTSSALATAAALPYELYREISENLHGPTDRKTLLSLSLVSKSWREQSQQALFMEFCDDWIDESDKGIVLVRHMRFLSSVVNHPSRLGPHVRTYLQFGLVSNSPESDSNHLLELTIVALKAMVNLRHLHIIPMGAGSIPPKLFENCTFQLRSLTLLFDLTLSGPFLDFLRTQPEIRHLRIGPSEELPFQVDFTGLPEGVCPNLVSISCIYDLLARKTRRRKVIALDTMVNSQRLALSAPENDAGQLGYLSLWIHSFKSTSDSITVVGNDIVILNVEADNIEPIIDSGSLWALPHIRAVVLVNTNALRTVYKPRIRRIVLESFSCFPKLECIVVQGLVMMNSWDHRFLTSRSDSDDHSAAWEQLRRSRQQARIWWMLHDDL